MDEIEKKVQMLLVKDAKTGCGAMKELIEDSNQTNQVYQYMDQFIEMLASDNSYVRNRSLLLIAANAKWDTEHKIDECIDEYLGHVSDVKPITARQCIQSLPQIAAYKPDLEETICHALTSVKIGQYKDSMQPLIERDIEQALKVIRSGK